MKNKTLIITMALVVLFILNIALLVGHIDLRNELKSGGILMSRGQLGFSVELYDRDFRALYEKIAALEEYLGVESSYQSGIKYEKRKDQK